MCLQLVGFKIQVRLAPSLEYGSSNVKMNADSQLGANVSATDIQGGVMIEEIPTALDSPS